MNPLDATLAWSDFWIIMGASGLAVLTMYLIFLVEDTVKERRRAQRRRRERPTAIIINRHPQEEDHV